jgi:hypothetical protein
MAELTQSEIDALIALLKKYPYLCSAGSDSLGPLSGPPTTEGDTETKDVQLYETEGNVEASYLTKNNVRLTIKTRNVDKGMALMAAIAKGDNLLASTREVSITLVPITSAQNEKTITFAHAYLQPGLKFSPGENGDPSEVELTYICKADATTGKPFTYA